jgi:hypothetical protein
VRTSVTKPATVKPSTGGSPVSDEILAEARRILDPQPGDHERR